MIVVQCTVHIRSQVTSSGRLGLDRSIDAPVAINNNFYSRLHSNFLYTYCIPAFLILASGLWDVFKIWMWTTTRVKMLRTARLIARGGGGGCFTRFKWNCSILTNFIPISIQHKIFRSETVWQLWKIFFTSSRCHQRCDQKEHILFTFMIRY